MEDINKTTPIQPEICEDGWYAYCPNCGYFDLEPIASITECPKCRTLIDWSWMNKFNSKDGDM